MSERRGSRYSMLQKIQVECKTCELSESFYSRLSVEQFKVRHAGHEVVEVSSGAQAAPIRGVRPVAEEKSLEDEAASKVAKVIVSMEASPALGQPQVRIRGFGADLEEAFSTMLPYDEAEKARGILSKGEFVDYDATGRRYVWEADAVEYELDAKEMLAAPVQETTEELAPEAEAIEGGVPQGTEDPAASELPAVAPAEKEEQTISDLLSTPVPAPEAKEETLEPPATQAAVEPVQQPRQEPVPAAAPPAPAPKSRMTQALPPRVEQKDDGHLLVSKSWYIQGGTGNRDEAVRVSKVLKEFRWRVEPVYTIGVILEDMLSIETSRNQISRALISRVEGVGYRLSAVTIEQGKPVAWFRKHEGTGADDSELDLEPDLTA